MQKGLIQNASPSDIINPGAPYVRIFRDIAGGYFAKLPNGTIEAIGGGGAPGWSLTGNAGTNPLLNFVGTTDDVDLIIKRDNVEFITLRDTGALLTFPYVIGLHNPNPTVNIDGIGETRFISDVGQPNVEASLELNASTKIQGFRGPAMTYNKNAFGVTGFIGMDSVLDLLFIGINDTVAGNKYEHTYSAPTANLISFVRDITGVETQTWSIPSEMRLIQMDPANFLDSRITINSAGVETKVSNLLGPSITTFTVNSGGFSVAAGAIGTMTFDSFGSIVINGSLTTGDPGSGNTPWKLGVVVGAAAVLDGARYVEVEISGVLRKLALIV